tara:strand:+ start:4999 stop:7308 length:2310 start_codon:yes stop_codon:yes gene_type:complete
MPDKSLRSEADKIINELREEGAREKEGLNVKKTVIKGSKINKESFGKKTGVGSLSRRVANNEKKISSIKKIIQFNKSKIGDNLRSLDTETDSDKNIFATGLSKILETISGIAKSFNNRTKTENKIKDKTRINLNRQRKQQREDVLEGKTAATETESGEKTKIDQSTAPGFLGGIVKFFKSILVGTALLALLKWVQNPDNLRKLEATLDFLSKHGDTIFAGILLLVAGNILWKLWRGFRFLRGFLRGPKIRGGPNIRGTGGTDPTRFNRINNRRTTSGGQQLQKGPLNRVREFFRGKNPLRTKPPITTSGGVTAPSPVRRGPLEWLKTKTKNIKNPFKRSSVTTGGGTTIPKNIPKNLPKIKGGIPKVKGGIKGGPMVIAADLILNMAVGQLMDNLDQAVTRQFSRKLVKKWGKEKALSSLQAGLSAEVAKKDKPWWHILNQDMGGTVFHYNKETGAILSKNKYRDDKLVQEMAYAIKYLQENDFEVNEKGKVITNKILPAKGQEGQTSDTKIKGDDVSQISDDSSTTKESKLKPYDLVLKHGYKIIDEEVRGQRMVKVYNPNVKYKSGPGRDFGSMDGQHPAITMMGTYKSKDQVSTEQFINNGKLRKSDKLTWNAEKLNNMSTETVNQLNKKAQGGGIGRVAGGVTDFLTLGMWDFDKRNKKGAPKDWGIRRMAGGVTDWATMGLTDFDKRGKGTLQFEAIGSNRGDRISQKVAKKERKINLVPMDQDQIASSSGSGSDQSEIPANASISGVESDYTSGVYGLLGGYG